MTQEELKTELAAAYRNYTKARRALAESGLILFVVLDICKHQKDFLENVSKSLKAKPQEVLKLYRDLKKSNKQ